MLFIAGPQTSGAAHNETAAERNPEMVAVYCYFQALTSRIASREEGATAVEYGLLVALIAAVIVAIVGVLGGQIYDGFCTVVTNLGGTCP